MKKILPFVRLVLLGAVLFAGCARKEVGQEPKSIKDLNNKALGLLVTPVIITPVQIEEMYDFRPSEVKSFLTFNELLTALKSWRVDAIYTSSETARYIRSGDDSLNVIADTNNDNGLRMLMRAADTELLRDINFAIAELKNNKILDDLYEKYVTNATVNNLAAAPAEIPEIEGAEEILVGINGDFPPYDYVSADGKPSGYNVALATEISRVLGKNLRFVIIPTEARFSALLSGNTRRMDVFFWYFNTLEVDTLTLTDAYARMSDCIIVRK
jgi:polar amino acid transport system substrate-binding protein